MCEVHGKDDRAQAREPGGDDRCPPHGFRAAVPHGRVSHVNSFTGEPEATL